MLYFSRLLWLFLHEKKPDFSVSNFYPVVCYVVFLRFSWLFLHDEKSFSKLSKTTKTGKSMYFLQTYDIVFIISCLISRAKEIFSSRIWQHYAEFSINAYKISSCYFVQLKILLLQLSALYITRLWHEILCKIWILSLVCVMICLALLSLLVEP